MKRVILISVLTLIVLFTAEAQQQILVENSWSLTELNIDGVEHPIPSNDEIDGVTLYIEKESENCYNFATNICHGMFAHTCNITDSQIVFDIFSFTTLENCDNEENINFGALYESFYTIHNENEPVSYTIDNSEGDIMILTVTNKLGYRATYINQSSQENMQQMLVENSWYLSELNIDGVVHSAPFNEEINGVVMQILTNEENTNCYEFITDICNTLFGYTCNITDTQINFDNIVATTLDNCWDEDNLEFSGLYNLFFMKNDLAPFSYSIDTSRANILKLTVTNKFGDCATYFNQTVSTNETLGRPITVYPNPASDVIHFDGDIINLKMYNSLGQAVKAVVNNGQIDVSSLGNGIYYLVITGLENARKVEKVIIAK